MEHDWLGGMRESETEKQKEERAKKKGRERYLGMRVFFYFSVHKSYRTEPRSTEFITRESGIFG